MPSVSKSNKWFVRVRLSHDVIRKHITEIKGWIDTEQLLCVLHKADREDENEHCHFTLSMTSTLQKQSFDVRIRKVFPDAVGAKYSSKIWDGKDEACSYMFHEQEAEVVAVKGFEDEDLQRFRMINANTQKVIAVAKQKSECKLTNKLVEWVKSTGTQQDLEDIWTHAYTLIRNGDSYHPGEFRLKTMTQTAYVRTCGQDSFELFVRSQFKANFREFN